MFDFWRSTTASAVVLCMSISPLSAATTSRPQPSTNSGCGVDSSCVSNFGVWTAPVRLADNSNPPANQDDTPSPLDLAKAAIEALIIQFADSPGTLRVELTKFIVNAADPLLAVDAMTAALNDPDDPAVATALANNPDLKTAMGRAIGASIVIIGLTDPAIAQAMQVEADAITDQSLKEDIAAGARSKQNQIAQATQNNLVYDTTIPETPDSPY